MKKFELDTAYENGRFIVVARTARKVIFLCDSFEFLTSDIFEENGIEWAAIYHTMLEADDNPMPAPANESDIQEFLEIAHENLERVKREENDEELIDELKKVVWLLKKRLFNKQLNSCPDCGGSMEFVTGGMGFFFKCSKCGHRWHGGILVNGEERRMQKIEQAIERWNSRKEVA